MMVDNYLEYNNLLNYLVLSNDFISTVEDPNNENSSSPGPECSKDDSPYPESRVFNVLAKYWIQIRLVEIEFTFFQFKGSLLLSNQLKNTVVPHKNCWIYFINNLNWIQLVKVHLKFGDYTTEDQEIPLLSEVLSKIIYYCILISMQH